MATQMEILRKMLGALTPEEKEELFKEITQPQNQKSATKTDKDLERIMDQLFIQMGLTCNLLGYEYLKYAVLLVYHNNTYIHCVTRMLYPAVAEKFETEPIRVERAIRHCLERSWDKIHPEDIKKYFGNSVDPNRGKPTSSEFIARIAEILHTW